MSDEQTEAVEQTEVEPEEKTPAWYRDQMAKKESEIEELRKQNNTAKVRLMERAFADAGLNPTEGLGKAIAKEYEGDPDPAAVRKYAIEEYGWEPPEPAANPLAAVVGQAQARVSQAVGATNASPVQPLDLEIADAEQRGDFASSIALKVQKFRQEQGI